MELTGASGDSLRLEIAGYQFPEIADDPSDSNRLMIDLEATVAGRSWRTRDPSMDTSEVEALAQWLEGVSRGSSFPDACDFLEPNLSFELVRPAADRAEMRAYFEMESRPPWAPAGGSVLRDLRVTLTPTREEIAAAAADLRRGLASFPARAPAVPGGACPGSCCR